MPGRVLAHHLIWTGYGHWLPNDPRGSGSPAAQDIIAALGPLHFGRKTQQPSRVEVKEFYSRADEILKYPRISFSDDHIQTIAQSYAETIRSQGYTCYACAILRDHTHLVIRAHRDSAETMIDILQRSSRLALPKNSDLPIDHPVWCEGGWKVFLGTADEIWTRVRYVERNPIKEGLSAQRWEFVTPYDGWPMNKKR